MLLRRLFIAALAPTPQKAFFGKIISASYSLQTRRTSIYFASGAVLLSAQYDHDSSRVSKPVPSDSPVIKPVQPRITLHLEGRSLIARDIRHKLSTLMDVPLPATLHIIYPSPAHPDLTAIWSIDNRIYYTNNDYRNVYILPVFMSEAWAKPRILG